VHGIIVIHDKKTMEIGNDAGEKYDLKESALQFTRNRGELSIPEVNG